MPLFLRRYTLLAGCLTLCLLAQTPAFAQNGGVQSEINAIVTIAEGKFNGLAETLTEEQYAWRPGEGVRSVSEVLLHIAGNNYWLPTLLGVDPPDGVPITGQYQSVVEFEKMTDRDEIIAAVAASFGHLKASIAAVPDEKLEEPMDIFGTPGNVRAYLIFTTTHLHEHLGQLIAYTRTTGVVPPWSQ